MRRPSSGTLAVAVAGLFGLVGSLATNTVQIPHGFRPWIWAATATLLVTAILIETCRNFAAGTQTPPTGPDLAQTADQLAQAIDRQWRREEQQRKIHDPAPFPVRWHPAADQLIDHWANIHRVSVGAVAGPITVAGQLGQIADVYRRIPSGRLVILGPGGAGKTILASRLALGLLESRPAGGPVPVIVSIASWNPTTNLTHWLTDQLLRHHPGLAPTRRGGPNLAAALLDTGLILPILDGFDEIPHALQRLALQQLNTTPDQPLILTSRPQEYSVAVAGTDVLTAAAGIELDPMSLNDLDDYLPRTTRRITIHNGRTVGLWNPVLTHLRHQPTDPASTALRQALSTPLMVYLARTIYSDTPEHNPLDLLNSAQYANHEVIENHLITAYLPAIYERPGPTGRTWSPDQAQHWLAYLARHLDQHHTRDLAWWQLRNTIPRRTRILALGLAAGLLAWLMFGFVVGIFGFAVGLAVYLALALAFGFGAGHRAEGPMPAQIHLQLRGHFRKVAKKVAVGFTVGLAVGFAVGLMIGLAVGLAFGPAAGVAFGPAAGLAFGLAFGLAVGLTVGLTSPIDITAEATPTDSLTSDRRNTIRQMLTPGLTGWVAIYLTGWITGGLTSGLTVRLTDGVAVGLILGLTVALGVGLAVGLAGAWGQWLTLVRIWLPLTGRLPWPILAFLADAHHRGVLRRAGAVYQFRHARLQHHLTSSP